MRGGCSFSAVGPLLYDQGAVVVWGGILPSAAMSLQSTFSVNRHDAFGREKQAAVGGREGCGLPGCIRWKLHDMLGRKYRGGGT